MHEDRSRRPRDAVWQWDAGAKQCVSRNVPAEAASRAIAARLARDALALAPDDRQARAAGSRRRPWSRRSYERGLDRPLDFDGSGGARGRGARARRWSKRCWPTAWRSIIRRAARAAAEILGRIGTAAERAPPGGEPAPLVRAVRSPDRRVRMAAARGHRAARSPTRRSPDPATCSNPWPSWPAPPAVAGRCWPAATIETLAGMGRRRWPPCTSRPTPSTTGRECVRQAIACPDYELVVIDAGIVRPGDRAWSCSRLRQDYRTATLRVAVVARSGFFERAERTAGEDPRSAGLRPAAHPEARPVADSAIVGRRAAGVRRFPASGRQQAARALACLATLASSSQTALRYAAGRGGRRPKACTCRGSAAAWPPC